MVAAHSIERINLILRYIDGNLDQDLSLRTIATIGCYSPFHLHRLFKEVTGEPLNSYISRKRIEKIALSLLLHKDIAVSQLAMSYGFSSMSSLTRTFTKFYGLSPTKFRALQPGQYSKIGQATAVFEQYICNISHTLKYMMMNAKIEIRELPAQHVACTTCIGVGGLDASFERMLQWARRAQLIQQPGFKLIRIFHDSFRITSPHKVRMSIGAPVVTPGAESGEIGYTTLPKGRHIVARMEIAPADFGKSWESLFVWMNENGYKKAPGDPFEFLHNNYHDHPEQKCVVDLCIPIV